MRKPSSLLLFTALCISLSQSATAQKAKGSSAMSAHQQSFKNFDAVLKDPNKANPELEKDLSVLLEPLVKRVETIKKQNSKHQAGELTFYALLEDAPAPIYVLPAAAKVDPNRMYETYDKKVEQAVENFKATYSKHDKFKKLYNEKGEAGLKKAANDASDQNAIVAEAGGVEALSQMTPGQAERATRKATKKQMDNPAAMMGAGANNPAMNKLMQDMIADPKLAARFEKMSEKEKQEFMKPYFANEAPRNDAQFEKTMKERNQALVGFDLLMFAREEGAKIMAVREEYTSVVKSINETFQPCYKQIEDWFNERYKAIPEIVMGEGHVKEPKQTASLYQARATLIYETNKKHAEILAEAWHAFKANSKHALAKLDAFAGNYKWGSHDAAAYKDAGAEANLAEVIANGFGLMGDLAVEGRSTTTYAKAKQKDYEEAMSPYRK